MRRKILAIYMIVLFIIIVSLQAYPIDKISSILFKYYQSNFYQDTGALNGVAAIYLNYRVFDTIFEALLLLVSIIGIIYFSRHEGDVE